MRMATFEQVGAFIEGQEEWKQYVERLEQYLIANGVEDAGKKRAVFLSTIGPQAYKLLSSLVAPAAPSEKPRSSTSHDRPSQPASFGDCPEVPISHKIPAARRNCGYVRVRTSCDSPMV